MSHVLLKKDLQSGTVLFCECGRILGYLTRPLRQDVVEEIVLGHREHVLAQNDVPCEARLGSTWQSRDPVDPLAQPMPPIDLNAFAEELNRLKQIRNEHERANEYTARPRD